MAELPSGTVTFLFTDVEGSTELLRVLGRQGYAESLAEHDRILRSAIAAHGGREVDNQGDSFFVAFPTATEAVAAAADAQRDLFAFDWPTSAQLRVRMGLHTAEPRVGEQRYVGIGVHRAARIGAAGHGGQVLVSSTTRELVEDDLPTGVEIVDLGERRLKDMDRPERLFQLVIDGLPGEFDSLRTLDIELARKRRRMYAGAAMIGVLAAAVAIPVFAFGQGGGSGGGTGVSGNAVAIIDPGSNRVSGQVAVGAAPEALAVDAQSLWVANTDDQSVSHIDLASGAVTRTVAVGGVPISLATGPKALWVVRRLADGSPELVKLDPRYYGLGRGHVVQGDAGGGAGVAVGPDGVWVVAEAGLLERLDPAGDVVTAKIDTGSTPSSVTDGAGASWAADAYGNTVSRIDPVAKVVTGTIPVGNGPDAVVTGFGAVWVADGVDGTVVRIDPQTNSVTTTIEVGRSPTGLAVGLGSVWVANSRDGTVSRIDPLTNEVASTISVGGSPRAIAVGAGRAWVSVQTALDGPGVRPGGVAHITAHGTLDSLDPAIAYLVSTWGIEYATCAKLLNYPDSPAPAGSRLEPEVAAAVPAPSAGGRSYAFTIRPGFRFSPPSNAPVTAQTFKFTIERALSPKIPAAPARTYFGDIVGARAYEAGKARHIAGLQAGGNTLTVRLTRPNPLVLSQLAMPFACAVPPGTPAVAKGLPTVPAAGPYYVASYTPAQGAVLKRNPNYSGPRAHSLDEIDYSVGVGGEQSVREIEAGTADFGADGLPADQVARLAARYGPSSPAARAGGQRYFLNSQPGLWYLVLNTSRPLFADVKIRRAVNYALDRRAITRIAEADGFPGRPTDQNLPPGIPGFRDAHIYPLTSGLATAKRLARGHGGRAVMYTCSCPVGNAIAQLVKAELAPLGINVVAKALPRDVLFARIATRGEPFDISFAAWGADYPDPSAFLNLFFDGRSIRAAGNTDYSYFDDPAYSRKFDAIARLSGPRRFLAYQELDADLARNAAPNAPLFDNTEQDFFSARIGCQVHNPVYGVDLAALCIKRRP